MAVNYTTAIKNARHDVTIAAIGASGKLEIGTAGMASVLATINLGNPAGTSGSGILTFSGFPRSDSSADATGTAAAARIRDGSNNDVITGLTVGTSGANINLTTTSVLTGQVVTVTSAAITHG